MKKKTWKIIVRHLVLALLAIIWLIPIVWLVVTSLSTTKGVSYQHFFPEHWTLANYHQLFFKTDTAANFPAWFKNTFIVAFFTCIVSSAFVLMVSYAFSCMRFKARKPLMSFSIILGMFPGVLSMIAVYFVLKMIGLNFMDVMDICSIFGNALDNAIECELKIPDKEKRLVHVTVSKQKNFLLLRFENYYEGNLEYQEGKLVTTKKEKEYHGYGLKSTRYTVNKYDGAVSIDTKENWFDLKILIPMREN